MRATTGETNVLPFPAAAAGSGVTCAGAGVGGRCGRRRSSSGLGRSGRWRGRGAARGRRPAARRHGAGSTGAGSAGAGSGAAGATSAPAGAMRASTVPTSTVSPSWHEDLGEDALAGARHLGVDLVGRDLEQRLVARDRLARLLEPLRDRALGDGHAHLRHHDLGLRSCAHISSCTGEGRLGLSTPRAP